MHTPSSSSSDSSVSDTSVSPTKIRTGSCLCKLVKYTVYGEPVDFRICHCHNCRRATGSAFMSNVFFRGKQVRVTAGEDKLKVYADPKSGSGAPLNRFFCPECGSNVFLQPTNTGALNLDYKIICHGTLDDDQDWTPQSETRPEMRRKFISGLQIEGKDVL